ncbi:MAG: hypothetical protein E7006_01500 [Alphaproteobacteria bacterium]|nr:hypothetical protein [Alphaproteobacteria bacterium]
MSFTQEKGLNIGENFKNQKIVFPHITPKQKTTKCGGCDKKCEIGTVIVFDAIYPTICGERVLYFKSEDGVQYPLMGLYVHEFKSPTIARIRMLQFGQELTRLCDHYKTR